MNTEKRTPEQEAALARFQKDVDVAEAVLKIIRETLTANQWEELIFLAHCEYEDQQRVEIDIFNGAINTLDRIAEGRRTKYRP